MKEFITKEMRKDLNRGSTFAHYKRQGFRTFDNLADCVNAMCKFFGIRIEARSINH